MRKTLTLLLVIFSFQQLYAQQLNLSGKIITNSGDPIPFATVYLKNTTIGTSANAEGFYSLKISSGKNQIIIKALGFRTVVKDVDVIENSTCNAVLVPEIYMLKDVIVKSGGEDPAYQIVRNAIKKRKIYLKEMPAFTCDVYIKGVQKLLKAPQKFLGKDLNKMAQEAGLDSNRTGIIYQSESQSRLSFMPPKSYREEMISSKVAGNNNAFSFNRASDLILNFYENYQDWGGISNRPFVSPIAENALFYYDYKLIGSTVEDGELINKIQLIPKRKYDPAYRGFIYIVEDSWRIYNTDFLMSKESNIALLDSLKINQQFVNVGKKNWMPTTVKFQFNGGLLAFKFGGYYLAIYNNYNLKPVLNSKDFKEVLKITKQVNKKDSTFWEKARPVPLTKEEVINYIKKDSIASRRNSKPYLDSLDKVNNHLKFSNILFSGYNPRKRYKQESYHFNGLLPSVLYNTVEGFAINYGARFTKNIDTLNNRYLRLEGNLRYGFSNRLFNANTSATIPLNHSVALNFSLGSDVVDLNNLGSIDVLGNTFNSLLYKINYQKLYQKQFASAKVSSLLFGSLMGSFSLDFSHNKWLQNSSNYAFRNYKDNVFTSNNPFTPSIDQAVFATYQSFKMNLHFSYNFSNKYVSYPTGKFYLPSKWPTLSLNYSKAFPQILGSQENFDLLNIGLSKSDINLSFFGRFKFSVEAGKFLNNKKIYYPDFKQFKGNKAFSFELGQNQYLFLDYYLFSSPDKYFEAHLEHNFSGFLTNKIPLIRKLKLHELMGVNYLATQKLKNYKELYFGISSTGLKLYYGFAYDANRKVKSGFRIAYGF